MPTPCPSRLKELIALANLEPDSETRKALQVLARAFKSQRQRDKSAPSSILIETTQSITVGVSDGKIVVSGGELIAALDQIDPPSLIGFIRECPRCLEIFWAGRKDKEACTRHAEALRKRASRQKTEKRKAVRAKRQEVRLKQPIKLSKLSPTAIGVINAVMNRKHTFWKIDHAVAGYLRRNGYRITSTAVVRSSCDMLVRIGLLTYHPAHDPDDDLEPDEYSEPSDPLDDRYHATQRLINKMLALRRKADEEWKAKQEAEKGKPTH